MMEIDSGQSRITRKVRVVHLVRQLYAGGTERLLSGLLAKIDHDRFEHIIVSLSKEPARIMEVEKTLGIPCKIVHLNSYFVDPFRFLYCLFVVYRLKPDLIKTWLPFANICGGIIGRLLRKPVIWGVHTDQPSKGAFYSPLRYQAYLSRFLPKEIVCCSTAVLNACVAFGYPQEKLTLITNGTDVEMFQFSQNGRTRIRSELGIPKDAVVIGMAANHSRIKRHKYFMIAAQLFLREYPGAHFILCGHEVNIQKKIFTFHRDFLGLGYSVHLLGIRNDMPDFYSALDIHTLIPTFESFGLANSEAMSCETLCCATSVGIMPQILEGVGETIPVSDNPYLLVDAWKRILEFTNAEKTRRKTKGRARIAEHYSLSLTAKRYEAVFIKHFSTSEAY